MIIRFSNTKLKILKFVFSCAEGEDNAECHGGERRWQIHPQHNFPPVRTWKCESEVHSELPSPWLVTTCQVQCKDDCISQNDQHEHFWRLSHDFTQFHSLWSSTEYLSWSYQRNNTHTQVRLVGPGYILKEIFPAERPEIFCFLIIYYTFWVRGVTCVTKQNLSHWGWTGSPGSN